MTKSLNILAARRYWTAEDEQTMRDRYPNEHTSATAKALGRDIKSVYTKAHALGLHKTAAYLASPEACRMRKGDGRGGETRFNAGCIPWNKGKHYVAGGRSIETRFKKGQWPVNKDPGFYVIGALRWNADGYLEMRVRFGPRGWEPLHRILWEDAHGPVPADCAVVFKDRDPTNVEIANLELISRADLMRRNTVHNLPAPLKSSIQLLGQLKRRIRERSEREAA